MKSVHDNWEGTARQRLCSIAFPNEIICDTFCNLHVVFVGHTAVPFLTIAPRNNNISNGKIEREMCGKKCGVRDSREGNEKTIWHTVSYVKVSSNAMVRSFVFFCLLHSFICCSCNLCDSSFYYGPPLVFVAIFLCSHVCLEYIF